MTCVAMTMTYVASAAWLHKLFNFFSFHYILTYHIDTSGLDYAFVLCQAFLVSLLAAMFVFGNKI